MGVMGIAAGANVALNLLLTPRMGLQGAVIATAISYGLGLVASAGLGRGVMALPIPWGALGACRLGDGGDERSGAARPCARRAWRNSD